VPSDPQDRLGGLVPDRPDSPARLADVGEDRLVSAVIGRYAAASAGVVIGPGDDAAVLDLTGPVVVSTDTLVERFDFRRDWSSAADVGVKVAAQNFADLAAMGARPVALLVSLAAPDDVPLDWATGLADGLADECARAGASVVGGDVSAADQIVITGTALGTLGPGVRRAVRRDGARAGDVVALAGRTGPSGAGLALLSAGWTPSAGDTEVGRAPRGSIEAPRGAEPAGGADGGPGSLATSALVTAHRAPRPPYECGPEAALAGASALIDTSDGLLRDAARVASASGVVLDLDPAALAPSGDLVAAAALLGRPEAALEWVLSGGEDHALVACFPPGAALPSSYRVIGRVLAAGEDAPGVLVGGRPWAGSLGWTHFSHR
jgi:thiamine-monophosphate kinase